METNNTNSLLEQFNATIDVWITSLHQYTFKMLCCKPDPGTWSMGQMYKHITDDTHYFVQQAKAALLSREHSGASMHEDAKVIFANNGFPDALLTGPATNESVTQPKSKEELWKGLTIIKAEVNQLYSTTDVEGATGKTQHPGLLFFSAAEWLRFAEMHMRHHFRQKKRIDDSLAAFFS